MARDRVDLGARLSYTCTTMKGDSMRINARLDEDRSYKLRFLLQATNQKISEIVKRSIDVYYEQIQNTRRRPAEILNASGFVGCGKADPDLSATYKRRLGESLAAKHDHR